MRSVTNAWAAFWTWNSVVATMFVFLFRMDSLSWNSAGALQNHLHALLNTFWSEFAKMDEQCFNSYNSRRWGPCDAQFAHQALRLCWLTADLLGCVLPLLCCLCCRLVVGVGFASDSLKENTTEISCFLQLFLSWRLVCFLDSKIKKK